MEPATYNFSIYQGATWARQMTYKDGNGNVINLSGYLCRLKIRQTWGGTVLLSLSNGAEGGITVAATSPNITVTLTPTQTDALTFQKAVYDMELESPAGVVDRLIEGVVTLKKAVTK